MEDFKELFEMFSCFYSQITHKKLEYDEFMAIFPKLRLVRENLPIDGLDLLVLIDELLMFKEKNLLELVNKETIDLIKKIYFGQFVFGNIKVLSPSDIIKHLLLPYKTNTCKSEIETFLHMSGFEFLLSFLIIILEKPNNHQQDVLRKYNKELYDLLIHYYLCMEKIEKTNDTRIGSVVLSIFSIFYFKQDEYDNNYSFINDLINNIVENKKEFIEYCDTEGIKELYLSPNDCYNTYAGIIKYMDESYKVKRNKKQ